MYTPFWSLNETFSIKPIDTTKRTPKKNITIKKRSEKKTNFRKVQYIFLFLFFVFVVIAVESTHHLFSLKLIENSIKVNFNYITSLSFFVKKIGEK